MRQIVQFQNGTMQIQEVARPQPPPGGILVQTTHSVISPGTEKMKVEQARMNLLQKAMARPDQVRKVIDSARTLGWRAALEKVRNKLESPSPLGYSASGIVIEVDSANTRFCVGDRVAIGGAECAFHAEILGIPDKLAAKVPDGVENWQAAYTTMAAISMQGVRQAEVSIGEKVLVIGSGLVGLLCTSILRAAGARVMSVDLDDYRLAMSRNMGAERTVNPRTQSLSDQVREWTERYGVDKVLLCTAGSNVPVDQGVDALRDRGIMVIVGITDASFEWKVAYRKDIQIRYSRSYGPGRYDENYEWGGNDYPIGYVRWTEQRNFDSCLELMRTGQIDLSIVTSRSVPFQDALSAYEELMRPGCKDVGVVLEYGSICLNQPQTPHQVYSDREKNTSLDEAVSCLDVCGAGNFVRTMLLPHLKGKITLGRAVLQTGINARHVKEKFGFQEDGTNFEDCLKLAGCRALLIGTRHHLHASMTIAGLKANRHVFVEKPLCLSRQEMSEIDAAMSSSQGSVMVGFNRRFAPATREVKKRLDAISGPKTITFRVFCGKLDPEHWYANYEQSGGRILGEACHFLDFFCYLVNSKPIKVTAQKVWPSSGGSPFPDSVAVQVEFEDGSSGQLVYTAEGDYSYPKEVFTVYAPGLIAHCENFQMLEICQKRKKTTTRYSSKGHAEEMAAWAEFLSGRAVHPLPYSEAHQSMHLTFGVLESIASSSTIGL